MISSNYKTKIIIIIGAVIFGVVIAASIISYLRIADIMRSQIMETSKNDIKAIQTSTETFINILNNSLMQTALDNDLKQFSNRYDILTIFDIEDMYSRLYKLSAVNYYFDDLYIYYHNDDNVIDLNGNIARFHDLNRLKNKDMIVNAYKMFELERYKRKFAIFNLPADESQLIMTMPVSPIDSNPEALIIMSLNRSYFQELLLNNRMDDEENIYVIDDKGNFLFGKTKDMITLNEPTVKNNTEGSFSIEIGRKSFITTFITSEETGWKYIYEVPSEFLMDKIKLVEIFLVLLTLISLFFAGAITIFVANILYRPIKKMTKALVRENKDESIKIKDEIRYINENIENLISEKKSIEQLLNENQPFLKKAVLEKLLTGTLLDTKSILNKLDYYNINIVKNGFYGIAVLSVDQYETVAKKYSDKQIDTLLIYQKEIIESIVKENDNVSVEMIYTSDNDLIIFLSLKMKDKKHAEDIVKKVLEKSFSDITQNIKVPFTMGVSEICDDISIISNYYEQANQAHNYKVILGTGRIIYFSSLPVINKIHYRYPFKLENEIFNCIKKPGMEGINTAFNNYFSYMKDNMKNYDITKYSFIQLFNDTLKTLSELSINSDIIFPEINNIYEQILSMETIDNVQQYFFDIFKEINEYISLTRSNEQVDISQKIISYINENYESEISLDTISTEMNYSVSYLVKVFRYETGKSIKECITEKRIERAKELLSTKGMKIIDVANKVGYPNTRSFINIFKKYVGVTPGQYKEKLSDCSCSAMVTLN